MRRPIALVLLVLFTLHSWGAAAAMYCDVALQGHGEHADHAHSHPVEVAGFGNAAGDESGDGEAAQSDHAHHDVKCCQQVAAAALLPSPTSRALTTAASPFPSLRAVRRTADPALPRPERPQWGRPTSV